LAESIALQWTTSDHSYKTATCCKLFLDLFLC